jgi:hypothetical protein
VIFGLLAERVLHPRAVVAPMSAADKLPAPTA